MKVLILNFGFGHTSLACAQMLREKLTHTEVETLQMNQSQVQDLPEGYDTYVLGCSIHRFRVSKLMRKWLRRNEERLCLKRFYLFMCCGLVDQYEDYLEANFSPRLLESAQMVSLFGGELKPEMEKGWNRFSVFVLRRRILDAELPNEGEYTRVIPAIETDAIRRMADHIRNLYRQEDKK